jgi:MoaA/NifB/PqqE/SkfB family radical SAM enzyme
MIKIARLTLRDEPFGYTLYDRQTLSYKFITPQEWKSTKQQLDAIGQRVEYLPANRNDFREDIVYSPIRVYWEVTLRCNLHCQYCFNNSGKPRPYELTTEETIHGLREIRAANVLDVRFSGGELTQRPDWYEILMEAKNLGFTVSCNTNGAYADPTIIDKLADLDLDQVTLSIDGKKRSHEKNRGVGTFDRTVDSLKKMHERGIKLRINTLITKSSLYDLDFMAELASEYATEINFFITRFIGRGCNLKTEAASFEEFYEMSEQASELRAKYPKLNLLHFEQSTVQNSSRGGSFDRFGLRTGPPDGTTHFNVTSDGGFWAGGYMPYVDSSYRLGNIRYDNIFDIWQHSKKLDKFRDESAKLELYCRTCQEFSKRCPGPNFELELFRKNKPGTPNPYCFYGDGPSLLSVIENKDSNEQN